MNPDITIRQSLMIILSICCSFVSKVGNAQSGWTVDECMQYAIEHNFHIQNKQLETKIAEADLLASYGNFLPSINATGTLGKRFGHSINPGTNLYTSESFLESAIGLNISFPIFEGFARLNRLQFYKLNKTINVLLNKTEENYLAYEVLEAFYRHCLDNKIYELAIEQRKLSEHYLEQMLEYFELGMRSGADLQEMKARLQSDIYQETVKSNSCHISLLALKELMNMKDTDTLSVCMSDEKIESAACPIKLNDLYSASELALPEFHIMKMKEQAHRESLSIAYGAFYPSVRIEFNLNTRYHDTEKNMYGNIIPLPEQLNNNMNKYIGIGVSLPLFSGLSRIQNIRKEKLRLQQAQNENAGQRLSLYREINEAYLSFQAASEECQLAEEQFDATSITWRESEEKWNAGMISSFELLEKRNRHIQAKAEVIRTKLQYDFKRRLIQFYQLGSFL